jgi:TonB family protein
MSSTNSRKSYLLILGGILVLALMAVAAIGSGKLADFIDLSGLLFVLVGGVALSLISFPGKEIWRALRHALGTPGNNEEIRLSILFWEATGRNFWILGVLHFVFNIILVFAGMTNDESAGIQSIINAITLSQLSALYGFLLALICFIPCWKLMGILQTLPLMPTTERGEAPSPISRPGVKSAVVVRIFSVLALTIIFLHSHMLQIGLGNGVPPIFYWPALLVVLGGVLALALFFCGVNSRPPISMSFAFMGGIGVLMAFNQTMFGIAREMVKGIAPVASALGLVLYSCFIALLGIIFVGAPLEDRAVRTGRIATPSVFSRLSWYGFPLLTLIVMPMVIFIMTQPLATWYEPQLTEVSATDLEPSRRYEARAPQSDPQALSGSMIQQRKLIYKVNPVFPDQARREGIQGTVRLNVIINEEGFVYEVKGNQENNPVLEQAAIPAVKGWRYSPYLMNGVPVAIKTTATVDFASK